MAERPVTGPRSWTAWSPRVPWAERADGGGKPSSSSSVGDSSFCQSSCRADVPRCGTVYTPVLPPVTSAPTVPLVPVTDTP